MLGTHTLGLSQLQPGPHVVLVNSVPRLSLTASGVSVQLPVLSLCMAPGVVLCVVPGVAM